MSAFKNILKGAVILSSTALMTSFVAYKSGAFKNTFIDSSLGTNSHIAPPDSLTNDSLNIQKDSLTEEVIPHLLPTSKSGFIFEVPDSERKDIKMMGSSKSLRMWEPQDTSLIIPDKVDTIKKVSPNQNNSNGNIQNKK